MGVNKVLPYVTLVIYSLLGMVVTLSINSACFIGHWCERSCLTSQLC